MKESRYCITEQPRIDKRDIELLDSDKLNKMAGVAYALSDPTRVQIIYLLKQREDICTCEFQEILDLPQSKISYHLKVLVGANILERKVIGNWRHYSLIKRDILTKAESLLD